MTLFLPVQKQASNITLDTTGFDKKLASTDDQVQDLATAFDEHTHAISEITGLTTWEASIKSLETDGAVTPKEDDTYDLGSLTKRWNDVYATNGTIQVSDEKLKRDMIALSDNLDLILRMNPVQFKFITGNRVHWGFGARQVENLVGNVGLVVKDELGNYALRYTELIAPIVGSIQEVYASHCQLMTKTYELGNKLQAMHIPEVAPIYNLIQEQTKDMANCKNEINMLHAAQSCLSKKIVEHSHPVVAVVEPEKFNPRNLYIILGVVSLINLIISILF